MSFTVKIVNKTAALQIILLSGGQQLPIPTTDAGVTNTFDLEQDDDRMQAERLYKALMLPSIRRQREREPVELVVEGFDKLEAEFGPKKPAPDADKPPARKPAAPPAPDADKPKP